MSKRWHRVANAGKVLGPAVGSQVGRRQHNTVTEAGRAHQGASKAAVRRLRAMQPYRPRRRCRCWKARIARRKSMRRKAGQNTSVK